MRIQKAILLSALLAGLSAQTAAAQDWNQWRGPGRDGVVSAQAPSKWPKTLRSVWKVPVGGGYSSPVVSDGRVIVHSRREESEVVSVFDLKTGKPLWDSSYPVPFNKNQYAIEMGKGPNSTPVVSGGRVYTLGVSAILSCFDLKSSELKWRKDFSKEIDTSKLFTGTAMSPVLEKGMVIVHVGDDRRGRVIAYDAVTGEERWKWEGDGPGYASPIVVNLEGERQLVTLTDKSAVGISADSGRLLWKLPFPDEWNENIVTPVLYQKTLIFSGVRAGTMGVKVARSGDQWAAEKVWHNPELAMYMSSPVLDGDHLYGLSAKKKGQFFCLDAKTGKTLWATTGREGSNAAVLSAGKSLLFLTTDASLIVVNKSASGFEQLARYTVADNPVWSHPVLLGKQILIKDSSNLSLWSVE
ncbi:MAG TPA: PQQ-binding-like beta-propeller repeat protein [Blastocatellia bacterium]|nr:PQQ-binding-like beta-propeller repeat protein [Blastocatellia bacterium]